MTQIYGGDTITDGEHTGVVMVTKFSLMGLGIEYGLGHGSDAVFIPESRARLVAYGAHDYVPSPARVCKHCGVKKRDHGDGAREVSA